VILYSPHAQGAVTEAMFEADGYFVQVTGKKVALAQVIQFASELRFSPG